ncbi:hypothetical protein BKA64DRAFT_750613, partial [Cadophora sp. MPI-SDFR-AT-0126]
MSDNPDPVTGWVLGELRKAANEGISVKELSDLLDKSLIPNQDAKNATWKALTTRADVQFVDETKAPLRNLTLTDVLVVGQGDVRIRLAMQNALQVAAGSDGPMLSIESDPQSSSCQSAQAPRKRRGRPPKAKKDTAVSDPLTNENKPITPKPHASSLSRSSRSTRRQSQVSLASSPLPPQDPQSFTDTTPSSASRTIRHRKQTSFSPLPLQEQASSEIASIVQPRKTRRRSQAIVPQYQTNDEPNTAVLTANQQLESTGSPANLASNRSHRVSQGVIAQEYTQTQPSTTSEDPDTIVVDSTIEEPKQSMLVPERENILASRALIAADDLPTDIPGQISSTSTPLPFLRNDIGSNGFTNEISFAGLATASPPSPVLLPEVTASADIPRQRNTTPSEPTPGLLDDDAPVESTQTRARRSSSRFGTAEILPEAAFTSQADMDWKDGKDGVYINPPGVKVKKPQHFKKKKHSTLVVFRSIKLKDPDRLVDGRNTWQERIMPVVTQARLTSADDAVEQGLVPKLNKKRKADTEVDLIPKKKEWGEGYPEDDSDSEYSGISILEAEVPPVPENPTSWSTAWTRDGAEARLNTDHRSFGYDNRAGSFTPSDSQTPYGSPSPAEFEESLMSPMVTSDPNLRKVGLGPSLTDPTLPAHPGAVDPPCIQDVHAPFTPSSKSILNLPAFNLSPAGTYRSPYAPPESASSPSGPSRNAGSGPLGDGYPETKDSTIVSFGKSTVPITGARSSLTPEKQSSSVAAIENFPALKLLQSNNKVSSYRSPYAVPTQNVGTGSVNSSVDQPQGVNPSVSQQDRLNGPSLAQPAIESPGNMAVTYTELIPEGKDISQPVEPSRPATMVLPKNVDKGSIPNFSGFIDEDLFTTSGGSRSRDVRGRSNTRGGVRGRRPRGRPRGGRGGVRSTSDALVQPSSDQFSVQSTNSMDERLYPPPIQSGGIPGLSREPLNSEHDMLLRSDPPESSQQATGNATGALNSLRSAVLNGPNSIVSDGSFPHNALQSQSINDVQMFNYGNPGVPQPDMTPATAVEQANGWVINDVGHDLQDTLAQSVELENDGQISVLETTQMTPTQTKPLESQSAISKVKVTPKPKPMPPPKTPKARSDPEEKLRARIAEAEDVEVPTGAAKFPCMYKDAVGNLVLSADQRFLDFFALSQAPPELPVASMKVFHMNGNPIMSAKGSFPMELHIKTKDDKNRKRAYRFIYASSAAESAQNIRTKIVAAMIASEFSAGEFASVAEAQAAKVRPFLCELCGDRFKNPNGLEYHLNKAKTKCNPNWDPEANTGKRVYRRKSKADKAETPPRTPRKKKAKAAAAAGDGAQDDDLAGSTTGEDERVPISRSARKITVESAFDSDGEEAPRSARSARKPKPVQHGDIDAEGDSDDSILDWARNNATSGYAKTGRSTSVSEVARPPRSAKKPKSKPKHVDDLDADGDSDTSLVEWFEKHGKIDSKAPAPAKAGKIYKALNREAEVADQIIKDFTDRVHRGEEEIFGLAITPTSQLTTAYEIATSMTCTELNSKWYEEVVTKLILRNEGMFPAENSVWFASVAIWLKQHPFTTVLPESKFCAKAVDDLVDSKNFTRVEFEFKDRNRNPRPIARSILTTNGLDMGTQRADLIKELIQETHPKAYVPSQLAPPPSALDKLQAVVARLLPSLTVLVDSQEEELDASPVPNFGDDSDSDDFTTDAQAEFESQESENDMDLDDEDDAMSALSDIKKSKKRDRKSAGGGPKRRRDAGHNAKISEGVRRRFAEIRAGGENPYPWNFKTKTKYVSPAERLGINEEQRRRKQELAVGERTCWGTAPTYMPNSETGAWDQTPIPQDEWMTDEKTSKSRYTRRQRLPEPITFLQAPDGSWSVRPYGHGVNPIYSRPSRRAEGNPTSHIYLNRIENSHRPIVYPPVKNRVNLPAVPSKRLLEAMESGRPIDESTGLPIVSRYAASRKRRASSAMSPENYDEPAPKRKRRAASVRFAEADSDEDVPSGRISRATGKPPRRYSRNFPKQVFIPHLNDPRVFAAESRSAPARKSARKPKFTEVEILNYYEPKKLAGDAPRNPGLDTIPAQYGLERPNGESHSSYSPVYNGIIFIDAGFVDDDQEPGNSSWTVKRLDTYRPADYNVRWDDATEFTVENLPYSDLQEDCSWIPGFGVPRYSGADYNTGEAVDLRSDAESEIVDEPKSKRQRKNSQPAKKAKQARKDRDGKYSYVRQHTALAMDFVDLFDDPVVAGNYFGVEIGIPNESTLKRSRNLGSNIMLPEMESRFAVSVMVIRILAGGLDLQVDWILVSQLFPEYSLNFLKKVWNGILLRKKSAIPRLEDEFREKFLVAYQDGEIPRIDYEHLTDYPWADLVDWLMKSTDCSLNNKTVLLPPTREDIVEDYELREAKEDGCAWRENYFSITTAVYKRIMASAAVPQSIPMQSRKHRRSLDDEIDDFAVCRSWVRAAAITPNEDWDRDLAKTKLSSFNKSLLSDVLESLTSQKIVKKRAANKAKNGRVYEIHDTWSTSLRRHMKESQFIEAVTFKRWMDAQFASGVQSIKADYFANEGTIMCLTSLQAHGRIRFVGANIPMNKFGLGDGGYETKKIPKERLRFNIDIYPTHEYIFDDANPVLSNILFRDPPRGGENGEIPIWYGLTGKPIWPVWYKILAAVGQVVALRAGVNISGLKESFKVTLEEWEWRLLTEWGAEVGVFVRLGSREEG